ncbi:hypothetical protein FACS1894202_06720 [Clostridia bacterium]|nr:hypothetical protein FACS1894202_06720 [Clostridia bacterium]
MDFKPVPAQTLATASVPFQRFENVAPDGEAALRQGTIFCDLVLPFLGKEKRER